MDSMKEEQKRQAQVIEDEMRRKDDLIAYLAHDLKTPLTSVIGYLSLLDEAPDMPGEQRGKIPAHGPLQGGASGGADQ